MSDIEQHLLEIGLRIFHPDDQVPTQTTMAAQFPDADANNYDRVLVTKEQNKRMAIIKLLTRCRTTGVSRVGEPYYSTGYWCMRVAGVG